MQMDASDSAVTERLERLRPALKQAWIEELPDRLELWAVRRGGGRPERLYSAAPPSRPRIEAWREILRAQDFRPTVLRLHAPFDLRGAPEWYRAASKLRRGGRMPRMKFISAKGPSWKRRVFRWAVAITSLGGFELAPPAPATTRLGTLRAILNAHVTYSGLPRRLEWAVFGDAAVDGVYLLPSGVLRLSGGVVQDFIPRIHVLEAKFAVRGAFIREGPPAIEYRNGLTAQLLELAPDEPRRWAQIDLALAQWESRS